MSPRREGSYEAPPKGCPSRFSHARMTFCTFSTSDSVQSSSRSSWVKVWTVSASRRASPARRSALACSRRSSSSTGQFLDGAGQADQEHVMAVQKLPEFGPHGGRFNDVVHHEVVPGVQQGGQAAVEALEDVRAEVRPVADFAFGVRGRTFAPNMKKSRLKCRKGVGMASRTARHRVVLPALLAPLMRIREAGIRGSMGGSPGGGICRVAQRP